jgi:hypothetical protein
MSGEIETEAFPTVLPTTYSGVEPPHNLHTATCTVHENCVGLFRVGADENGERVKIPESQWPSQFSRPRTTENKQRKKWRPGRRRHDS